MMTNEVILLAASFVAIGTLHSGRCSMTIVDMPSHVGPWGKCLLTVSAGEHLLGTKKEKGLINMVSHIIFVVHIFLLLNYAA